MDTSLQDYYAARVAEYDRLYDKPERQVDLQELQRWLPTRLENRRVLEIACGTGYWTQFVATSAREIVAIDAVEETLQVARGRVPAPNVTFMVGDAFRPPLDQGPFDAALAAFWFSHVPISRRREFLVSLAAVLSPGARVVLVDNRYVEGSSTPISEKDEEGNTYQLRRLGNASCHRVLKNFPSEAELRALTADFGEHPSYTLFEYYWVYEYMTGGH